MNTDSQTTATNLREDIEVIVNAFQACGNIIKRLEEHYEVDPEQLGPRITLAIWAHYKFAGDWEQFFT